MPTEMGIWHEFRVRDNAGVVCALHTDVDTLKAVCDLMTERHPDQAPFVVQEARVLREDGASVGPVNWRDM